MTTPPDSLSRCPAGLRPAVTLGARARRPRAAPGRATRRKSRLWLCLGLLVGGCSWPYPPPAARNEQTKPPPPREPPLLVSQQTPVSPPEDASSDTLQQRILDYIRNVDGLTRRVAARTAPAARPGEPSATAPAPPPSHDRRTPPPIAVPEPRPTRQRPPPPPDTGPPPAPDTTVQQSARRSPPATAPAPSPVPLEPPALLELTARADAAPPLLEAAQQPARAAVNAPASAADPQLSLRDFARRWAARAHDPSFQRQLDARLLHAAAGNYEAARQPLQLVSDQQQRMASRFIEAYIALRERSLGEDPAAGADLALRHIEQLAQALRPLGELRIPTLALCRAVSGYGQYQALEPASFPAGVPSEFVLYCELEHFAARRRADGLFESRFDMRTALLTPDGTTVLTLDDRDIVDTCRNRRRDCFIPRLVRLPATLSPGQYVVKVTVVDKLANKVAERRTTFRLSAGS